jgi:hypothetical protein
LFIIKSKSRVIVNSLNLKNNTMKKFSLALATLLTFMYADAQNLRTPQPSTTQSIKQDFGLGNIELNYSRPNAKGRKVMGDLVPFDKVWRTGANQATVITFSDDVTIGGTAVKAGKYGVLTIPGAAEWTIILTKDLNVTSPSAYKQENDVVRVKSPVSPLPMQIETFTFVLGNISNTSMEIGMMWEKTYVGFTVNTDVDAKVMKQIDDVMNKDNRPYFAAASYYFDNGKDLNQARAWVDKAIEANPKAYWMTLLKARIHAKQGDNAGAKAMCDKTIELATAGENPDYVKMATELKASLK